MTILAKTEKSALVECEEIIERGLVSFVEVGNALLRIRNERLYREGFGTFQEYCETKWEMSRIHAHRMIDAAEVAGNLLPKGNIPQSERVARPLAQLEPEQQQEAWDEAVAASPTGKPTAAHVKLIVEKNLRPVSERINYTPSNGLQYAQMAIDSLEKIQVNDTQRNKAFQKVKIWIAQQGKTN